MVMAARIRSGVASSVVVGSGEGDRGGDFGSWVGFVWGIVEGDPPGEDVGMGK